jgi:hypothetical protein
LSDGEINVLFECKDIPKPNHIRSVHINFIQNKELVQEYLANEVTIPHIKKQIVMEPVANVNINSIFQTLVHLN